MEKTAEIEALENGMFSIIIPAFKCKRTILNCVNSVLSQDYKNFEILVIDDGCPEKSFEALSNVQDNRVTIIHSCKNMGVAFARNKGIKQARGQYIAFLDADDFWHNSRKLSKQKEFLDDGSKVVFSEYYRMLDGKIIKHVKTPKSVNFKKLLKGNVIGNLTGCYDASIIGKFYQEKIGHEDYLMWLNIIRKADVAQSIQEPLATYSVSKSSLSSNKLNTAFWQWKIYREKLYYGLFKSFFLLCFYVFNASLKRF